MLLSLGTHVLAEDTRKKMESLESTALEKLYSLKERTCLGSDFLGWWDWPEHAGFEVLRQIQSRRFDVSFDLIVVVGIGGSFAGTKAVAEALRHQYADQTLNVSQRYLPIVYAGNNLSERSLLELLDLMEEYDPVINVISKSGGTIEPNLAFRILEESLYKRYGHDAAKRIFITTQSDKNPLCELAGKRAYTTFPIPEDVGGRYSVFTAAGLVPLTLAGYDTKQLLAGADRLFSEFRSDASAKHPALQYACFRKCAWDEGKTLDILAYREPKLAALVEWWKQLFAESEGKDAKGLMPMGMSYSTDLHSLGQYLQEGPACMIESFLDVGPLRSLVETRVKIPVDDISENRSVEFLFNRYLSDVDEAAWKASLNAHSERGIPCIELKLSHLDEYHLGYLLAFFQVACGVGALLLGVNPFNQPGVEIYKKEMHRILTM